MDARDASACDASDSTRMPRPDTEVVARMTDPKSVQTVAPPAAPARVRSPQTPVLDELDVHTTPTRHGGLRLTKLTLNGFKSFADKTTFTFDEPVTGVVGPNGCGKSNLVDAIKWVLGERSSKSLRGKEMIDVIFAGSAARKPAGMSSVTLTFENPVGGSAANGQRVEEDEGHEEGGHGATPAPGHEGTEHDAPPDATQTVDQADPGDNAQSVLVDRRHIRRPLPIDADEVAVERQLYRDGTSKYLINGKRARLRDIRDLFLDTGIGADAYSIIEQGKVDAMLLASPQERRTIFEEAAGIAKYKQRRIESQRKLDRAESNLVRTREQLESTERRLRIVRGQAVKARRFTELDGECSALRLAVAFDQYDDVRQRLEAMTSQLQGLEAERERTHAEVESCEASMQESELAHSEAVGDLRTLEDAIREAEHDSSAARQRRQMAERSIEEARRQLEIDNKRLEAADTQIEALTADIEDQRSAIAAIAERAAEAERSLEQASQARAGAMETIAGVRHEREQARSRLSGMEREQGTMRSEAESLAHRLEELTTQRDTLAERLETLDADRAEAEQSNASLTGEMADRCSGITRLETSLDELSSRGETLAGARRERAALVDQLSEERVSLDARRATLDEMVRTRAGLAEAAKWVMQRREAEKGFEGVVAPLAELVETDTDHAAAVEAALGHDLQAIVTQTIAAKPTDEELEGLPGRVRFIPLHGLTPSHDADEPLSTMLGVFPASRLTPMRSLVRPHDGNAETAALLDRLLAHTFMVENLDAALMLAAGPMSGRSSVRFVTKAGEVLDEAGNIDAGPSGVEQGVGLIRHAAELTELETRLAGVMSKLDAERGELGRLDEAWAKVNEKRESVSAELAEQRRSLAAEQARADRLEADIARLSREAGTVREEIGRNETRGEELDASRRSKLKKADSLAGLIDEQREKADSLGGQLADLQSRAEAASEQMSAAREEAGRANAQLDAARRELDRQEREIEAARESKAEHERHAAQARDRHAQHERVITEATELLTRAEAALGEHRSQHESRRARVKETESERSASAQTLQQSRERARLVERDWHGVEASRRELEVKRESLEERTSEDMRLDLAVEYLDYRAVMAPGDVERVDIPDAQARINVLRGEIKKLGNVNLDSIAEEGQLTEADEDLRAQLEDLDEARRRLTDLIERLNTASRERFGEVFGLIRENFGGRDGMFRRLFGGGRAEVRLMGLVKEVEEADGSVRKVVTDETDLLESGIEVIAKPPGKEPRSISQLSGGEKTLTAVAMLMAIFRSKPSCFCVLDEVDAALDEVNVGRYCKTVRSFTDMSSFIVITHNKRTMQMADHLYGVTQQERGVSKRVSVRFDKVGADGSFDADQAEREPSEKPAPKPDTGSSPRAETTPASRPSGVLRKALAKMREESEGPVKVER